VQVTTEAVPPNLSTEAIAALPDDALEEAYVVRFDAHERIQHILLVTSFLALVVTGFPQKFPSIELCQWLMDVMGGIQTVRLVHRIAGGVMIFDGVYHMAYVSFTVLVLQRTGPLQMIPNLKDVKDAVRTVQYFLGMSLRPPKYGRFSYLEKFDYWAVFWGMFVMGGSGLILLFPVFATRFLPGQIIIASFRAHSDEALLAVTWIAVVHIFYAHLAPRIFPFNMSIFSGRVPASRYRHEHPLEYEKLVESGKVLMAPADAPMPSHLVTETPVVVLPDYLQTPAFNTPEDHHNSDASLGAHANGGEEPDSDA
jgi:cytochrome b subunit of formate dehydrogenase